ncbi:aldo-keto reductase family 1 member B1-like [Haliotis rubra]|uniref:aldo-keto reductase family 1 member B1-like n=1 Tax=Haliotis rubra TaxID=36100 RepID=UPI001EE60339|nr:aldo-keto reductase family 1 member B1-like [Haliotis rubra]
MADRIPRMRLRSSYNMPMLGLGTNNCSKVSEVGNLVRTAIQIGYRYIDTTSVHETQQEIGDIIIQLINDGRIKREELFIVAKIFCHCHEPEQVEPECRMSLEALNMDYIDLYLLQFPMVLTDKERTKLTTTDFLDTWRAMEKLVDKGLVRSVGVSNFNKHQLERILKMDGLKYKPANNQMEITPSLSQDELLQFSLQNGISTTGCEPFATPGQAKMPMESHSCQEHPTIATIANKYGKSAAQVILRWGIQRGYAVVPKATNPFCLVQSMDIFNFELCTDDMQAIKALDKDTEYISTNTK